jgi:hypothetical protein
MPHRHIATRHQMRIESTFTLTMSSLRHLRFTPRIPTCSVPLGARLARSGASQLTRLREGSRPEPAQNPPRIPCDSRKLDREHHPPKAVLFAPW